MQDQSQQPEAKKGAEFAFPFKDLSFAGPLADPLADLPKMPKMEKQSVIDEIFFSVWGELTELEMRARRVRRKFLLARLNSLSKKK